MRIVLLGSTLFLAGCAGTPFPPSELVPPAKRCMFAPRHLASLKVGDDLVSAYASVERQYGNETSKTRCLQKWVRTVTH